MLIDLTLNGRVRTLDVEPHETLLAALRTDGLVSVRYGSETGETGAAAVLLDDRLVNADALLAAQAAGHEVTTVEAFDDAELDPVQAAFVATGAMQSGYSTVRAFDESRR